MSDCIDSPAHPERLLLWLLACIVAVVSVRPNAGCWNDGSRLATVESLVDRHTFAIDDSIFVHVPPDHSPYIDYPLLARKGTQDKMRIVGHFYSDKSPVPAVLMAFLYAVWSGLTGLSAAARPGHFCYFLGLFSSGLAYVVAVLSLDRLARVLRLAALSRWTLIFSFAVASVAVVYLRRVNNHILLLGVAMAMMPHLALLAQDSGRGEVPWKRLALLGTLAGFGYTIDLGAGPSLLLCMIILIGIRFRGTLAVGTAMLAALPWVIAHHALNYWVGGTWSPANANPEYFDWPGSPFSPNSLTGAWNHKSLTGLAVYSLALLFGKRGFVGHNMALYLLITALPFLLRLRPRERPELGFALVWSGLTWALYAWASTNYSGQCCSVRWFVPLLAPCYFAIAVLLRYNPRCTGELLVLSAWGAVLTGIAWCYGPWIRHMVPGFWHLQVAALMSWLTYRLLRRSVVSAVGRGSEPVDTIVYARIRYEPHPATALPAGPAGDRVGREQLPAL
jgi:hypothetical protein